MSKLVKLIDKLGFDVAMHCTLVYYNFRPAVLLETYVSPNFDKVIDKVKKYFSNFIFTDFLPYGILISNIHPPFDKSNYTEQQLGDFLGYPCAGDVIDGRDFAVQVWLTYKMKAINMLGFVCSKANLSKLEDFFDKLKKIINKINLDNELQIELFNEIKKIYEPLELIDYIENDMVDKYIETVIWHILNNYGYSLLEELHNNSVINIFSLKYMLIQILILCHHDVFIDNPNDYVMNILHHLYGITI